MQSRLCEPTRQKWREHLVLELPQKANLICVGLWSLVGRGGASSATRWPLVLQRASLSVRGARDTWRATHAQPQFLTHLLSCAGRGEQRDQQRQRH
jgi:hypothetical protein